MGDTRICRNRNNSQTNPVSGLEQLRVEVPAMPAHHWPLNSDNFKDLQRDTSFRLGALPLRGYSGCLVGGQVVVTLRSGWLRACR